MPLCLEQILIDSVYDGITETPPWKTFLHLFRRQLNCQISGMWFRPPFLDQPQLTLTDNDIEYEPLIEQFYNEYYKSSALFHAAPSQGEVRIFSSAISKDDIKSSSFYKQFLKPNNIASGLQFYIEEADGLCLWIEVGRSNKLADFGVEESDFCHALTPHLTRALGIYSSIQKSKVENDIYQELIEQLAVGIVILDHNARVMKINSMTESMLAELDGIDLRSDRIVFSKPEDQQTYAAAVEHALAHYDSQSIQPSVELLRINYSGVGSIGLLVKSAVSSRWYEGSGCPAVVLYLCDPSAQKSTRETFVSKLFGLTLSEANLAILLADGMTLAEAAKKLNVTENTTRTVSKRIFSKTGVRRQAELVRLILSSMALLG
ncbi:MAG: hypothetical protein V7744_06600 [Pseudomonadales bacterium]